jgi:hypothetical protein
VRADLEWGTCDFAERGFHSLNSRVLLLSREGEPLLSAQKIWRGDINSASPIPCVQISFNPNHSLDLGRADLPWLGV